LSQHVDLTVVVANQIGARDVTPTATGGIQSGALTEKTLARLHHVFGEDAIANDLLVVVHVVDEQIQRGDPLLQSFFDILPFGAFDHSRYQVNGQIFSVPA
jgi:hypothetical protein